MSRLKIFDTSKYVSEEEKLGEIPNFPSITKRVLKIVWPSVLEAFLVSLVIMFDGIQVSSLGNEANAAVTVTKQPIFLMICFITALNIAVSAIVARRKGENDSKSANKAMHTGLNISIILSIILSVSMLILSRPICQFMGAEADTIEYANTYLKIIAGGFIFNSVRLTINACQRGVGDTKVSMYTNVIANLVNVLFNYLLITGKGGFPALGIAGAAVATVLGNAVACIISISTVVFKKGFLKLRFKELLRFDSESFHGIMHIFPSTMIEQTFMRVGFILFALIVNNMGTKAIYVHGVCNDINSLLFTLADGFAIGTSALVGHRLGEKRKDLAVVYAKVSTMLSVCAGIFTCSMMLLCRNWLISLYKPASVELFTQASNILIIAAVITIPQNIQWVLTGVLRGSGDTKFTAVNSFVSVTIIRPVLAFVLCYFTPLGLYGAWLGMLIDQSLRCIANIWRFKSRVWLHIKV